MVSPKNIIDRRPRVPGASNYQTARFVFILPPHKTKDYEMCAYLRRSNASQFSNIVNCGAKRKSIKCKTDNETDKSAFYSNGIHLDKYLPIKNVITYTSQEDLVMSMSMLL